MAFLGMFFSIHATMLLPFFSYNDFSFDFPGFWGDYMVIDWHSDFSPLLRKF